MARHFISQNDLSTGDIWAVFELARRMKPIRLANDLQGKSLVMFFEKSSTRTRLSFEIGMTQLGGHAIYLDRDSSQLSRGESIADTARVVSRYADLLMARVNSHATVDELAAHSSVPVINGLSDEEHPCQSMADLFTIWEHKGTIQGIRIAYVGDGNNNVTHSLMLAAPLLGARIAVATPPPLAPAGRYLRLAQMNAAASGGSVTVTDDAVEAVADADVVYTDVWISMGREAEESDRLEQLRPYQVDAKLFKRARPDAIFMHCLPAHVGHEVTSEVAYGERSVIFDEAENRLHIQKALMVYLMTAGQRGNE